LKRRRRKERVKHIFVCIEKEKGGEEEKRGASFYLHARAGERGRREGGHLHPYLVSRKGGEGGERDKHWRSLMTEGMEGRERIRPRRRWERESILSNCSKGTP